MVTSGGTRGVTAESQMSGIQHSSRAANGCVTLSATTHAGMSEKENQPKQGGGVRAGWGGGG